MLSVKTGVAIRLRQKYPMAIENHCMCHTAALPCEKIFNNIDYMNNFQQHSFKIKNLIKLSPYRDNFLESCKKTAPPDKLNALLAKVGRILSWNPTRMTENCNSLDSIKKNYPYLSATFENMANP